MDPTPKNNDCYFFYYSKCTKGDNCAFRHEPSALGCEVMCSYWQQGNCMNEHCNFRHMELKKNRKSIACFWELQAGGCRKPHCPFLHVHKRPAPNAESANPIKTADVTSKPVTQEWSNRPDDGKFDGSGTESDQGRGSSEAGSIMGSPTVDPLIVNFDEESDSEGVPSPVKPHTVRVPYCKTYEEIRLEEIQAESAAYYSYEPDDYLRSIGGGKEKRVTSVRAARRMVSVYSKERPGATAKSTITTTTETSAPPDFTILTLDEIRRRKAAQTASIEEIAASSENTTRIPQRRKELPASHENSGNKESGDFLKNAIKTLAELKAANMTKTEPVVSRKRNLETAEIYTTNDEDETCRISKISKVPPVRLRRSPKRFARVDKLSDTTDASPAIMTGIPDSGATSSSQNPRTEEIEVRLCDSSTSDDTQAIIESTTMTTAATTDTLVSGDDVNSGVSVTADDIKLEQLCDTNLSVNDDEYLTTVDTASEDILKDIDALLKEKTTV